MRYFGYLEIEISFCWRLVCFYLDRGRLARTKKRGAKAPLIRLCLFYFREILIRIFYCKGTYPSLPYEAYMVCEPRPNSG